MSIPRPSCGCQITFKRTFAAPDYYFTILTFIESDIFNVNPYHLHYTFLEKYSLFKHLKQFKKAIYIRSRFIHCKQNSTTYFTCAISAHSNWKKYTFLKLFELRLKFYIIESSLDFYSSEYYSSPCVYGKLVTCYTNATWLSMTVTFFFLDSTTIIFNFGDLNATRLLISISRLVMHILILKNTFVQSARLFCMDVALLIKKKSII